MGKAVIMTPYAATIDTANVLGEYPRPQMVRENWINLNGIWQFQAGISASESVPAGKLSSKILVPFPEESAISGIMEHHDRMWYRRTFTIPASWAGQRVLVHFGAVDFESQVYINGQSKGIHKGGYDPFTYDITSSLTGSGLQTITVRAFDPTDAGGQPRGKQTLYPGGIMYTPTSGIWQSVWLEPVPQTSISDIKLVPDVDNSNLKLKAITSGTANGLTVNVEVKDGSTTVATYSGNANADLVIPVANPKLWTPDSPFLYDLKITLKSGAIGIDSLTSYFGMRKISMAQIDNYKKMMLNNKFLFQFGPLDQGFWPDGLYTAPTDLAIQNDLLKTKQLGFNMIRKHIKVEPYRWYYWADKLGILVWQDMPSSNSYNGNQPIDEAAYKSELERMVQTHWNSPCIIMWDIFNEGQGQQNTQSLVADVNALDPSRLVNQASGGNYYDVGQVLDAHSYPPPSCPSSTTQILVCGEYGGIGLNVADHIWAAGSTYVMVNSPAALLNMYGSFADQLIQYKTNNGLSAAVYTQITDVETELNGLLTYDRAIVKADITKFFEINQRTINSNMYVTEVLPTSYINGRNWNYTTTEPTATNWYAKTFDDSSWQTDLGGFGTSITPGVNVRTVWDTSDIWMRQNFTLGNITPAMLDSIYLNVHHDEDCEIYLNGVLASTLSGYTSSYQTFPINDPAKRALIANGSNNIAVHCHQTYGGQYMDAGLSIVSYVQKQDYTDVKSPSVQPNCKIYPNPASSRISVIRKNAGTELVGVYNLVGGEVMKLNKSADQVDISKLQSGMYFIKTQTNHEVETISFIKK